MQRVELMLEINAVNQKQGVPMARLCKALQVSRATLYRHNLPQVNNAYSKRSASCANAMTPIQQQIILDLLHSARFVDQTPYDIFYTLLDEGQYYCSIRTMYRLLEMQGENLDRRQQRCHRDAVKPELLATAPNQVWSWDITLLLSERRLSYYYLYVILDIFSRYVVGWLIADCENKELARKLIQETTLKHAIQPGSLILHADNGPSMTSGTVGDLLEHLGVVKSHNRPYTSNDNPFSESQFKTLKYCPQFPKRFASLQDAEQFCQAFFSWYNQQHYHSGIQWLTPESVHYGKSSKILAQRHQVLMQAYQEDPLRFNRRRPTLKQLQPAVYINPPENNLIVGLQQEANMA